MTLAVKGGFMKEESNGSLLCTAYQFNVTASSYELMFSIINPNGRFDVYGRIMQTRKGCSTYYSRSGYTALCKEGTNILESERKVFELVIEFVVLEDFKRKWICCVFNCSDPERSNVVEIKQHGNYCSYIVNNLCECMCVRATW